MRQVATRRRQSAATGGLLWRVRATLFLVVLALGCVAFYLAALLVITDVHQNRALLWIAAIAVVGTGLAMIVLTLIQCGRRGRRALRNRALADRALAAARALPGISDMAHQRVAALALVRKLDLVRDASDRLDPAESRGIRVALRQAGVPELLEHDRLQARAKWKRAEKLGLVGWVGGERATAILTAALRDPDRDVAHVAAQGLAEGGSSRGYRNVLDAITWEPLPAARLAALLEHARCQAAVTILTERHQAADEQLRFWVAYLLGCSQSERAVPALTALSRDPSPEVRASAAAAIARLPGWAPPSLAADRSSVIRSRAARAVGAARDTTSLRT